VRSARIPKLAAQSFRKEKYSTRPSSKNDWYSARDERLKLDNYQCSEIDCNSTKNLQVHHKIPVSRGGSHALSNLITLCSHCHAKQHSHITNVNFLKRIKK
jgi:5-methylcytosine-specific restriction endonuclease McrA